MKLVYALVALLLLQTAPQAAEPCQVVGDCIATMEGLGGQLKGCQVRAHMGCRVPLSSAS